MSEFIPHQLHLTKPQIRKLMTGKGVNIPYAHMGSDKGSAVVMLHPANAKRLLTGFRKSKGVRIALTPAEMEMSATEGRGFNIGKAFKKLGHTIERGAKKTFTPRKPACLIAYKVTGLSLTTASTRPLINSCKAKAAESN